MNIVVFYGGKSCEHDISIITGRQVAKNLNKAHKITEVYVDRTGQFFLLDKVKKLSDFNIEKFVNKLQKVTLIPKSNMLYAIKRHKFTPILKIDCALMCFHGLNGEDGTMQGLLELCNVPYTSCGVLSSSIGMDKILMKLAFKGLKLNILNSTSLTKRDYIAGVDLAIIEKLGYPLIVKPSNLGSSIGIKVCNARDDLVMALDIAFEFDSRVLIETALTDFYEINCSALFDEKIIVSDIERPQGKHDILTFEDKYLSNGSITKQSNGRIFPYTYKFSDKLKQATYKIYESLNCKGVVRVDFLIDKKTEKFYVNEINTIPGSLAFYLWKGKYSFSQLLDIIIKEAINDFKIKSSLNYAFQSNVLLNSSGVKNKTN